MYIIAKEVDGVFVVYYRNGSYTWNEAPLAEKMLEWARYFNDERYNIYKIQVMSDVL